MAYVKECKIWTRNRNTQQMPELSVRCLSWCLSVLTSALLLAALQVITNIIWLPVRIYLLAVTWCNYNWSFEIDFMLTWKFSFRLWFSVQINSSSCLVRKTVRFDCGLCWLGATLYHTKVMCFLFGQFSLLPLATTSCHVGTIGRRDYGPQTRINLYECLRVSCAKGREPFAIHGTGSLELLLRLLWDVVLDGLFGHKSFMVIILVCVYCNMRQSRTMVRKP